MVYMRTRDAWEPLVRCRGFWPQITPGRYAVPLAGDGGFNRTKAVVKNGVPAAGFSMVNAAGPNARFLQESLGEQQATAPLRPCPEWWYGQTDGFGVLEKWIHYWGKPPGGPLPLPPPSPPLLRDAWFSIEAQNLTPGRLPGDTRLPWPGRPDHIAARLVERCPVDA